jgi:hypothetical protein
MKFVMTRYLFAVLVALMGFTLSGVRSDAADSDASGTGGASLPKQAMEKILKVEGAEEKGLLSFEISRNDFDEVQGPVGVKFTPAFGLGGDCYFQPLEGGRALLNGDLPLKESEVNPFISELLRNHIVVQAFHQHAPTHPQVWFVHYRAEGDPVELAKHLEAALKVTSIKFPQSSPKNPQTSLDKQRLKEILKADSVTVGEDGVVTAWIYRTDKVSLDGTVVSPQTNISTNIQFKPMGASGQAAVMPDFSMTAKEVTPVLTLMLNELGWNQGCLYNQEIDETPQLFFDHMLKTGDAYKLAAEIRRGLDLTGSK